MSLCECGCGGIPKHPTSRYVQGHNQHTKQWAGMERKPCACGCGRFPKRLSSKYCAGHASKGENTPMFGVRLTGKKNHFYGKEHTSATKEKLRQARTGTKLSEETKRKVSEAGRGRKHSKETRAKISASNMGKTMSQEARKKMSITRLLRIAQTQKEYCDEWRDKEFKDWVKNERDGRVCQHCGDDPTEPKLIHLHHIDENKKNCHPHNLITLCMSCHMHYHCILDKGELPEEWQYTAVQNTQEYYNEL